MAKFQVVCPHCKARGLLTLRRGETGLVECHACNKLYYARRARGDLFESSIERFPPLPHTSWPATRVVFHVSQDNDYDYSAYYASYREAKRAYNERCERSQCTHVALTKYLIADLPKLELFVNMLNTEHWYEDSVELFERKPKRVSDE